MKDLTKNLMCIQIRSGVEIWIEAEKAEVLQNALSQISQSKFVRLTSTGETLNTADVVGIFKARTMAEYTKRKNGKWKCEGGKWHDKGRKCKCYSISEQKKAKQREEAIKNCGKCNNGFIEVDKETRTVGHCKCVKGLS